jgi:GH24 family phage-related lysozyme (muramidase)
MQEKVNAKATQSNESEAPVGNVQKMAPPAFQLKADPIQKKPQGEGDGEGDGVPAEFMDHLKLREGWRTKVYLDSRGLPTVGLGHLLTASEKQKYPVGTSVSESLLNSWAQQDAKKAYDAAVSQAAILGVSSQAFINALASVNFQLGTAWNTKFKKTWGYMTKGEWEKAALECQDSAWFSQTPVRVKDFQEALRALAGHATVKPSAPETASTGTYDFKIGNPTGTGSSTGDGVNVRKGPGTQFDKTGSRLGKGASVTIYGEVSGWYCIGQGKWVSKDFISTSTAKAAPSKDGGKPAGPDVNEIAKSVWEGMFGGYTGIGTDEDRVYNALAKLKHDGSLIAAFKAAYKKAHGTDVVADIKSEFSNSMFFGNQLDKALGYLNATGGGTPAKAATPAAGNAGKEAAAKPKTPTVKAPTAGAKSNFDVDKAVAALNANAEPGSLGKCAKYVRLAINAGGVATPGNPVSACNYNPYLEKFGFKKVSTTSYEKGDIAVFEAFQGDKKYHEHGHIQMWNGTQWVSDFKQRDYWAGPDYRKHKPGSVVYRM